MHALLAAAVFVERIDGLQRLLRNVNPPWGRQAFYRQANRFAPLFKISDDEESETSNEDDYEWGGSRFVLWRNPINGLSCSGYIQ